MYITRAYIFCLKLYIYINIYTEVRVFNINMTRFRDGIKPLYRKKMSISK